MRQEIMNMQNELMNDCRALSSKLNDLRVMIGNWEIKTSNVPVVIPRSSDENYTGPAQSTLVEHPANTLNRLVKKLDAWEAVCDDCGQPTTVKFKPNPKWPVRCLSCYKKHKESEKQ